MATDSTTQQAPPAQHQDADAPTPAPLAPVDGAPVDGSAATFSWNFLPDAQAYQLQIGTTPGFEDVICTIDAGDATHLTVYEMLPEDGSVFYWRIRARTAEDWLPWSAPQPFEAATDEQVEAYTSAQASADAAAEEREEEAESDLLPPFLSGETPRWRTALVMSIMVVSFVALSVLLVDVALDLATADPDAPATVEGSISTPPTNYEVLDAEAGTYQIPVEQAMNRLAEQENAAPTRWTVPE